MSGQRGPEASNADAKQRLGNVNIYKGSTKDGIPVVMWDATPPCNPTRCKIQEVCPYTQTGKCTVRLKYLNHIYTALMGQVDPADPMAVFTVGFHLVPLYNQLIQFKMEEYGSRVMGTANNGKPYVNPIFKEIRETIKVISAVMKDMTTPLESDKKRDSMLHGDNNYYESLFEDGPEIEVRTRNKV